MLVYKETIDSTFQAVDDVVNKIHVHLIEKLPWINQKSRFQINFILREILNNAVEHGNQFNERKKVFLEIYLEDLFLKINVWDEGSGIQISDKEFDQNDVDSLLRERQRGFQLLEKLAEHVEIKGNQVSITLQLYQEEQNGI